MSTATRLDALLKNPPLTMACPKKAVFFSDCHEGDGGKADDFEPNKDLFLRVNAEYKEKGFTRFFLGDTWERWQFSDIGPTNTCIDGEVFIKGNHDADVIIPEAILLTGEKYQILLVHGHQGDWWNDNNWWFTKWAVKYIWKTLEYVGIQDQWLSASVGKRHDRVRKALIEWANDRKVILIHGHIHTNENNGFEWDCGSQVTPGKIECIELLDGNLSLRTWN